MAVHVVHDYKSAEPNKADVSAKDIQRGATFWQFSKTTNWQIFLNNHLAISYGSYRNQDGTSIHTPWKMATCVGVKRPYVCLLKRVRPGICPCEHNAFFLATQNDPTIVEVLEHDVKKSLVRCGSVSVDKEDTFKIPVQTSEGHTRIYGLPFTLQDLLPLVARNNHVIVTGVSYAYRDMLMNFICNLRRLGLYDSLVIAAFDEEMYRSVSSCPSCARVEYLRCFFPAKMARIDTVLSVHVVRTAGASGNAFHTMSRSTRVSTFLVFHLSSPLLPSP